MKLYDYEKEHLQYLRSHLAECAVLLKSNGDFPLSGPCRIAAYGSGVRNTVKGGTGSGEVNSRYFVTVEQGLENAGFSVTTKKWMDAYDAMYAEARKAFIRQIKAEAKAARINSAIYGMGRPMPEPAYELPLEGDGDVAIYVLSRISGEGNDRSLAEGDVKLSASEKRDILAIQKKYKKFMLVLNTGGVVDLSEVGAVENILILSQLGVETGDALADILLGKENPSGRLTTTWSAWEDYCAEGTFGDPDDTYYKEGIYVGYRYFDTVGKKALFPFGHGLSYTSFETRVEEVKLEKTVVTLSAAVKNTGGLSGKEVVQVYVSAPAGKLDKPWQELAGFSKTAALEPGGTELVQIAFDLKDLASYDESRSAYILEPGRYLIRVGSSSADTKAAAVIELDGEAIVRQVRSACGDPGFADWRPESGKDRDSGAVARAAGSVCAEDEDSGAALTLLALSAEDIHTETVLYDQPEEIDDAVKNLTDEQLICMNVGAFDPNGNILSIIGNASKSIAGAAGETTSMLKDRGVPAAIMADGPAGLRLSQQYYRDEKGAHGLNCSGMPETVLEFMSPPLRWLTKRITTKTKAPKGAQVGEQYCTAIPIGTALAQSWNLEFARGCGDIVGEEMERFGVHFWLAPALNIHRSILCGRNFEYFSEDPLISGKFAAAITLGVQAHPGRGTTIKHYAANNQERNRYGSDSNVSERAMREIYLKGFGICVKEAQPHAVMTSYNLLNGVHTAQRRDLSQDVLRSEFGFKGVLMTDWVVGGSIMTRKEDIHPAVEPCLVAAAGGDLFMPGGKQDYENIRKGLADGKVTRQQLLINATRVYRMVKRLTEKR